MATQIKGQIFVSCLAALEKLHGAQTVTQVTAKLDGELAQALKTQAIVSAGWYPVEWYAAMHVAMRAVCGPQISARIGRETSIADINQVFRFVMSFFSAETLIGQAPRIFRTYCQPGKLVVEAKEKGRLIGRCEDCAGANQGVWEDWLESFATFLELGGGKNVTRRVLEGGGDKDSAMRFELTWR